MTIRILRPLAHGLFALVALICASLAPVVHAAAPEKTKLTIAVGGKPLFYYLPLTVAERRGYFKDEGLDVTITDFPGGSKALQSLMGGSAEFVSGAYEHTIALQAKKQYIRSVVVQGRYAGIALGIRQDKAANFRSMKDLQGMKVGVTAPGSSTHIFVKALLAREGLPPDAAAAIGVGTGSSAVAAIRSGNVDAVASLDPVTTQLETSGDITVVYDTRKESDQRALYGDDYAAAVIYTTESFIEQNPNTVQAVVNAMVRALRWIQQSTPDQIADIMPKEYYGENEALYRQALAKNYASFSPDGRMTLAAAQNVHKVLATFDPAVQQAGKLDLERTFTNRFVDEALKKAP